MLPGNNSQVYLIHCMLLDWEPFSGWILHHDWYQLSLMIVIMMWAVVIFASHSPLFGGWWLRQVHLWIMFQFIKFYYIMYIYLFNQVVLLDECSQMTEPLSLLPIKRAACHRLVLVGDPRVCTGLLFPYPSSRSAQTRNLGEFFCGAHHQTLPEKGVFDSGGHQLPPIASLCS